MQYTSSAYFFAVPTRVRHENAQFHFLQPERVMFCAKIRPVLNLTNTVTDVQSTKLTLNLNPQEPINSEHFLSHSNHSHTDMQSDAVNPTRENSFFT